MSCLLSSPIWYASLVFFFPSNYFFSSSLNWNIFFFSFLSRSFLTCLDCPLKNVVSPPWKHREKRCIFTITKRRRRTQKKTCRVFYFFLSCTYVRKCFVFFFLYFPSKEGKVNWLVWKFRSLRFVRVVSHLSNVSLSQWFRSPILFVFFFRFCFVI